MAGLKLKAEDYPAAAELYELGAKHDPTAAKWLKSLAAVYLKSGDDEKLADVLDETGRRPIADDSAGPQETGPAGLAARRLGRRGALVARSAAHRRAWTLELHHWRAEALSAQGDAAPAAEEYAVAVELEPDDSRTAAGTGANATSRPANRPRRKTALEDLLKRDPDHRRGRRTAGEPEVNQTTARIPPARRLARAVNLADFQRLIREMYFEKDVARGIDGTFMWLMEEVGELAAALRNGTHEERLGEFADVLAWLATIANVAGVDLTEAVARKYGSGCPGCGQFVCTCADAEKP